MRVRSDGGEGTVSNARDFYLRNAGIVTAEPDAQVAAAAMRTPGDRYFCIFDRLADTSRLAALELGFGSAVRATALAGAFARYETVDVAADRLIEGSGAGFAWRVGDLDADWPYADGEWDVVIAMMVIEHLYDPFHSFRELARVLRPGGYAFVNLPNIASFKCRLQLLAGAMPVTSTKDWFQRRQWDGGHLHGFTVDLAGRLAALNGLTLDRLYPVGRHLWLKRLRPSLLCHEISYVLRK
jgi:SAM-dependent methyltransferase